MTDVLDITEQLHRMINTTTDGSAIVTGMKAAEEIERLRAENEKLRAELAEYKRNGIVDVTGSINYHSGYDEGVKNERERCVMIAEEFVEMPNGYFRAKSQKEIAVEIRAAAAVLKET